MEKEQKLIKLFGTQPKGTVFLSSWLTKNGFSTQLLNRYKKSGWIYSIGIGAWMRTGEKPTYLSAIYALQEQADAAVHPGGKTALSLMGKLHYLELSSKSVTLFGGNVDKLPKWFSKYNWGVQVNFIGSAFLVPTIGLQVLELGNMQLRVSSPARALMECLHLAPEKQELVECYQIMEGLNNLRPIHVQQLLEACSSIKVKRLFLYMAEKVGHEWFRYIDFNKVDLGRGKRSLVRGGVFVQKYQITIPRALALYE